MNIEISRLAVTLQEATEVELRRETARELRDMGFTLRRSLKKRGTLTRPAATELGATELEILRSAIADDDPHVRLDAIITAGDLGDETLVPALWDQCSSKDRDIKLAAIDALSDIGGIEGTSELAHLAADQNEDADYRFAALTGLEVLVAKRITSGPDRRFDPPEAGAETRTSEDGAFKAKAELSDELRKIESDSSADELLKLKASDVRGYLEAGIA